MLINESIVTKHAEDAAFLWPQRDEAVRSNHHTQRDLLRLDDRLAANLEGLLLAGERGWELCREELFKYGDEGEVFGAGVLALHTQAEARLDAVFAYGFRSDACARALVAAIAWQPFDHVAPLLQAWLESTAAFERYLAIAGYAAHRAQPAGDLTRLLADASERVARRAVRAVAELGRADLIDALRPLSEDPRYALEACVPLACCGAADEDVLETLFAHLSVPRHCYRAALALALAAPRRLGSYVRSCLSARNVAGAIALIEASGEVAWMPALIRLMEDAHHGHLAGEALRTITGADLEQHDLIRPHAVACNEESDARRERYLPLEEQLALPSELAVARWWKAHEPAFEPGLRYLNGTAIGNAATTECGPQRVALQEIAASARPRQCQMASCWLSASSRGAPLINTRAFRYPQRDLPGWRELPFAPGASAPSTQTVSA